jgi:hypothetical protein
MLQLRKLDGLLMIRFSAGGSHLMSEANEVDGKKHPTLAHFRHFRIGAHPTIILGDKQPHV